MTLSGDSSIRNFHLKKKRSGDSVKIWITLDAQIAVSVSWIQRTGKSHLPSGAHKFASELAVFQGWAIDAPALYASTTVNDENWLSEITCGPRSMSHNGIVWMEVQNFCQVVTGW